jgi:hypothetical protein
MQGHIAYPLKPALSIMAVFPGRNEVVIFIFFSGDKPVKFTDLDGKKINGRHILGSLFIAGGVVVAVGGAMLSDGAVAVQSLQAGAELIASGLVLIGIGEEIEKAQNSTGQNLTNGVQAAAPSPVPQQPDNNDDQKRTEHGEIRHNEARNEGPHRDIGDPNRTIHDGRHFTETGNDIYVKGNKGVVVKDGQVHSQFHNTKANTLGRIQEGRWIPSE